MAIAEHPVIDRKGTTTTAKYVWLKMLKELVQISYAFFGLTLNILTILKKNKTIVDWNYQES